MEHITPAELQRRLQGGERLRLLDIRERPEWQVCRLDGAELRPMSEIHRWQDELGPEGGPWVVYCHHGVRSVRVCAYLESLGHQGLINLRGGIAAWRDQVDPQMPGY
ncbi:MAG: sulfurtransferase [Planctomycetes bacterium]|nr:sulfurtransferase [Planctomycetota bacterium]MBL7007792.1 sulfurtransferase [Planctomycetota bacterium]